MGRRSPRAQAARSILGSSGKFVSNADRTSVVTENETDIVWEELPSLLADLISELMLDNADVDDDILELEAYEKKWILGWSKLLPWNTSAPVAVQEQRGFSRRSVQRRAQSKRKRELSVQHQAGSIRAFFLPVEQVAPEDGQDFGVAAFMPDAQPAVAGPPPIVQNENVWRVAITQLDAKLAKIHNNARMEKELKGVSFFSHLQHLSVRRYLALRLSGMHQVEASISVARTVWEKESADSYKSRCIPRWADEYLNNGTISESRQGKHPKTHSIIFNEDAKDLLRIHLRETPPLQRTPGGFRMSLNNEILRTIPHAPNSVSEQTARRWMYHLGFHPVKRGKNYYVDGHEREDVVLYRNAFLERMANYQRRIGYWDGAQMEIFCAPVLREGERRLIIITHDESIYYSNEAVAVLWEENGRQELRPKSRGRSQHVSGFCCPCCGFLEEENEETGEITRSFVIITPGKNADGYWTNDDLVLQLQRVMPLFERQHPGCDLLFMFDNSGNHHKAAPGGLCAADRNLSDGGAMKIQRDSVWKDAEGVEHEQCMYIEREDGVREAKGLKTILTERGLWPAGGLRKDDACTLVAAQPDFLAQREWLRETIENAGHTVDYYPKFHCELNYIEMVWAYSKQYLRRQCTYSFPDLVAKLPDVLLDNVPVTFHRRALRHCFRFMSGYRQGLQGPLLDYVMKKYRSHREVPRFVDAELVLLKDAHKKQLLDKIERKLNSSK